MSLRTGPEKFEFGPPDSSTFPGSTETNMTSAEVSEAKPPTKTKYYDIVRPRIKMPSYQHVGLIRYRTVEPQWDDDGITIPQNIGRHVLDEDYHVPRASPPFRSLQPDDLWFPLTPLKEWKRLDQQGVEVTDTLLTVGEILLANHKILGNWRCKPSPLRNAWTYT